MHRKRLKPCRLFRAISQSVRSAVSNAPHRVGVAIHQDRVAHNAGKQPSSHNLAAPPKRGHYLCYITLNLQDSSLPGSLQHVHKR